MNWKKLTRVLIVVVLLLDLGQIILDALLIPGANGDLGMLLGWNGYGSLYQPSAALYYGYFLAEALLLWLIWIEVRVGLIAYCIFVAFFALLSIFGGVIVSLPPQVFVATLNSLATGALLVAAIQSRWERSTTV